MTAVLDRSDGALRARLDEDAWASVLHGQRDLPRWAAALPATRRGTPTGDGDGRPVDEALFAAVALHEHALVEVEVAAATESHAVLASVWADALAGSALVRGLDVTPGAGPEGAMLRPGIEVSAFMAGRIVDEVMRLVPDAPAHVQVAAADVPEELTVAMGLALRTGDRTTVEALSAALGFDGPPPVLEQSIRTMSGNLTLTVRSVGRPDVSVATWLRCDAGWVELSRTADGIVRHVPRTRDDVAGTLVLDLSSRWTTALRVAGAPA